MPLENYIFFGFALLCYIAWAVLAVYKEKRDKKTKNIFTRHFDNLN